MRRSAAGMGDCPDARCRPAGHEARASPSTARSSAPSCFWPARAARHRDRGRARTTWPGSPARWPGCGFSRRATGSSTARCSISGGEILVVSQFTLLADTDEGEPARLLGRRAARGREAARRALLRRPFRPRRLGRDGRLRRQDERRARQRRTCHERPPLGPLGRGALVASPRCYPPTTAFHLLDEMGAWRPFLLRGDC